MSRPFRCRTLDDYLEWVDKQVEYAGGWFAKGHLQVDDFLDEHEQVIGAILPKQEIHFHDGTRLAFHMLISADLVVNEYSFMYMTRDGGLICRLDNHPGHERQVGGTTHLHRPRGRREVIEAADEYDFDDALQFVRGHPRKRAHWPSKRR